MASLRDTVKDYQDELRDGIAWVAFWKQGRSWNAEYFHLDMDGTLYPEDRSRLEEIKSTDPAAVILNGYYCGHLGEDMSLDELTAGVRYHYENSMNDIDGFIGAHDDRLPPEVIEEARAAAHEAGLPFSEKPYRDGEDFNPYVFDGSMSIEDFELMHRMMNEERSEHMDGRKRTVQIKFRVTEAERDLILEKMKLVPTRNMAAYLRKIAIDGYIIQIDHADIKAMTAEIQKIGVNVNQIARRVNATGNAYQEDIEEIKGVLAEIWRLQRLSLLKAL